MNRNITACEIFAVNQVLTIGAASNLIGKTIAISNAEYSANKPSVRICKILGLQIAYEKPATSKIANYESTQAMWIAGNNQRAIKWAKNRTVLKSEGDEPCATCEASNRCLLEGTFFGSDADREIYFVVL
jgi:hypothetical protein